MGYGKAKTIVLRNEDHLKILYEARRTLRFKHKDPEKLADKIREAIYAAGFHEEYKKYRVLKSLYKFHPNREAKVLTVRFMGDDVEIVEYEGDKPEQVKKEDKVGKDIIHEHAPVKKTIPDAATVIDIATTATQFSRDRELYFPNAILDEESKRTLFHWTQQTIGGGWKFIDQMEKGITLTKNDIPEEILWKPENN